MWMISERKNFWDETAFSEHSQVAYVTEKGEYKNASLNLKSKKILILIHGFNNTKDDVIETYFKLKKLIEQYFEKNIGIVGYVWPGLKGRTNYRQAKHQLCKLKHLLGMQIQQFIFEGQSVDILAHSMGVRLSCKALIKNPFIRINRLFCLAPAISSFAFDEGKKYRAALKKCAQVFIVYSHNDLLLKFGYFFLEQQLALGWSGNLGAKLPSNCIEIDSSAVIPDHNAYKNSLELFAHLQKLLQIKNKYFFSIIPQKSNSSQRPKFIFLSSAVLSLTLSIIYCYSIKNRGQPH